MALEIRKDFKNNIVKYEAKDLVIKDANVIQWLFEEPLDRFQKDMYNYCISLIRPTDDPKQAFHVVFDVAAFCKKHSIKSPRTYKRHFFKSIELVAKESPRIWIHDSSSGEGIMINIFSTIHYNKTKGIVNVELNHYIYACFIARKISIGSLRYTMDDLTALKTFNATRLLDCILENHIKHEYKEAIGFYSCVRSVDNLATFFNFSMDKRTAISDFKRCVLNTAVRDLNANSSIAISDNSPIAIKEGRKTVAFEFLYKFKENKLSPVILENDPQLSLFNTINESLNQVSASKIVDTDNIDIVDRQIPAKPILLEQFKTRYNILGKGRERLEAADKVYLFKLYCFVRMRAVQEFVRGSGKLKSTIEESKYINWCTAHESIVKIKEKSLNNMIVEFNINTRNIEDYSEMRTPFEIKYM